MIEILVTLFVGILILGALIYGMRWLGLDQNLINLIVIFLFVIILIIALRPYLPWPG